MFRIEINHIFAGRVDGPKGEDGAKSDVNRMAEG